MNSWAEISRVATAKMTSPAPGELPSRRKPFCRRDWVVGEKGIRCVNCNDSTSIQSGKAMEIKNTQEPALPEEEKASGEYGVVPWPGGNRSGYLTGSRRFRRSRTSVVRHFLE